MGGKYAWIVLFVTLQISVVLCRSTEKPKEEDKVIHAGPILLLHGQASVVENVGQYFADNVGEPTPESPVPSEMSYDVYTHDKAHMIAYNQDVALSAVAIFFIAYSVFIVLSLTLGCILYFCCKKEPRRGYIVNSNTEGGIQQPQTTL